MSTDNDLLAARTPAARTATEPTTPAAEVVVDVVSARIPLVQRGLDAVRVRFRLPTEDDAPPTAMRMLGMASWAAACVFLGLIPAGRLIGAVLFTGAPGWYMPVTVSLGMLGLALIAAAFSAIHRAHLPWQLLGVASLLLLTNLALVYIAL